MKVILLGLHQHRFEIISILWVFIGIFVSGTLCDEFNAICRANKVSMNIAALQSFLFFMLSVVFWPIFLLAIGVAYIAQKSGEEIEVS